MKVYLLPILLLFLATKAAYCQLSVGGSPVSVDFGYSPSDLEADSMPVLDLRALAVEDSLDSVNGIPPRFAYPHQVDFNTSNSGEWDQLVDGNWLWRIKIYCPGALSVSLLFDQYHLTGSSVVYIYDENEEQVEGGYTGLNNKGTYAEPRGFATSMVFAETVILELFTEDQWKDSNVLSINYVAHGYNFSWYNDLFEKKTGFGESKSCHRDVRCSPEGDDWQDEKNSVAMMVIDGSRFCTGSLLNNSCEDGTPYFMTASHCLNSEAAEGASLDAWTFWWNYEADECDGEHSDTYYTTVGAELRMRIDQLVNDVALLELLESPNDVSSTWSPYYNGWTREDDLSEGGVAIHHPVGDVKMISLFYTEPELTTQASEKFRTVLMVDNGNGDRYGVEGGSSGSPGYLSSNHLVFGPQRAITHNFKCIKVYESAGQPVTYGVFSAAWDEFNDPEEQLQAWLGDGTCGNAPTELGGGYFFECEENKLVSYPIFNTKVIKTSNNITGISVIGTQGNVDFKSGNQIVLGSGFEVKHGGKFSASIEPCVSEIYNKRGYSDWNPSEDDRSTDLYTAISIYPNPTSGAINVFNGSDNFSSMEVYNTLGVLQLSEQLVAQTAIFVELPVSGVYFFRFEQGSQSVTKRVVVQ